MVTSISFFTIIQENAVRDATESGQPAIQVSPQRIKIKLRPSKSSVDIYMLIWLPNELNGEVHWTTNG